MDNEDNCYVILNQMSKIIRALKTYLNVQTNFLFYESSVNVNLFVYQLDCLYALKQWFDHQRLLVSLYYTPLFTS